MSIIVTKTLFILLSVVFYMKTAFAVTPANSKEKDKILLKEVFDNINKTPKNKKSVYRLKLQASIEMKDTALYKNKTTLTEIIVYEGGGEIISEESKMYFDKSASVMMMPLQNLIYVSDPQQVDKEKRMEKMLGIQSEMLNSGTIVKSTKHKNTNFDKVLEFIPDEVSAQKYTIAKIDFYINATSKKLSKVVIHYNEQSKIKQIELVYLINDYNYHLPDRTEVLSRFIDDKNRLKEEYKTFKLMDFRSSNAEAFKKKK